MDRGGRRRAHDNNRRTSTSTNGRNVPVQKRGHIEKNRHEDLRRCIRSVRKRVDRYHELGKIHKRGIRQMFVLWSTDDGIVNFYGSRVFAEAYESSTMAERLAANPFWTQLEHMTYSPCKKSTTDIGQALPVPQEEGINFETINVRDLDKYLRRVLRVTLNGEPARFETARRDNTRSNKPECWPPSVRYVNPNDKKNFDLEGYTRPDILRYVIRYIYDFYGVGEKLGRSSERSVSREHVEVSQVRSDNEDDSDDDIIVEEDRREGAYSRRSNSSGSLSSDDSCRQPRSRQRYSRDSLSLSSPSPPRPPPVRRRPPPPPSSPPFSANNGNDPNSSPLRPSPPRISSRSNAHAPSQSPRTHRENRRSREEKFVPNGKSCEIIYTPPPRPPQPTNHAAATSASVIAATAASNASSTITTFAAAGSFPPHSAMNEAEGLARSNASRPPPVRPPRGRDMGQSENVAMGDQDDGRNVSRQSNGDEIQEHSSPKSKRPRFSGEVILSPILAEGKCTFGQYGTRDRQYGTEDRHNEDAERTFTDHSSADHATVEYRRDVAPLVQSIAGYHRFC